MNVLRPTAVNSHVSRSKPPLIVVAAGCKLGIVQHLRLCLLPQAQPNLGVRVDGEHVRPDDSERDLELASRSQDRVVVLDAVVVVVVGDARRVVPNAAQSPSIL